jgi:hypothetical protein
MAVIIVPPGFVEKVDRTAGSRACWPWMGSIAEGYGRTVVIMRGKRRSAGAHQVAHFLATGRWEKASDGRVVRHLCRNRRCCNPAHLAGGTHRDNARDRVAHDAGVALIDAACASPAIASRHPPSRRRGLEGGTTRGHNPYLVRVGGVAWAGPGDAPLGWGRWGGPDLPFGLVSRDRLAPAVVAAYEAVIDAGGSRREAGQAARAVHEALAA